MGGLEKEKRNFFAVKFISTNSCIEWNAHQLVKQDKIYIQDWTWTQLASSFNHKMKIASNLLRTVALAIQEVPYINSLPNLFLFKKTKGEEFIATRVAGRLPCFNPFFSSSSHSSPLNSSTAFNNTTYQSELTIKASLHSQSNVTEQCA